VTAGRFRVSETRSGAGRGELVYGRRYLARTDAVEIDPAELRLSSSVYETGRMGGFFGAIRDSMPDYWGRLVIERHSGLTRLEEFDYLMEGADDRAGALGFGLNAQPPTPRRQFNRTLDLQRLHAEANAIVAGDTGAGAADAEQAQALLLEGTSMGGARPKAVVQDDHSLWIAKFSRFDDRWNNPRVEHALLLLARECGLSAATSRLESIGGRESILVRRFDRNWSPEGGGGFCRHRMVSALTLLQTDDSQAGRARWSYLLLADEIRRVSAAPRADLRELFARMCFNAAISNLDDHPRNHALLASDREWRLSPAYDLTPSPVSKANLLAGGGRYMLGREDAQTTFARIAEQVRASWRATMRREGISERDCEAIRGAFLYDGLFLESSAIDA
jgi:serine/threonine-protein kinase HipA